MVTDLFLLNFRAEIFSVTVSRIKVSVSETECFSDEIFRSV